MKKILTLIIATFMLSACGSTNSSEGSKSSAPTYDRSSLSVITPTGAPALAFYRYSKNTNFETNSDPSTGILPLMVGGKKDVVVLPTNAGIQAIVNKKADYQIAATITFGNFYLLSMGNDANNQLDENDTILLFQKGNVPDKIFHYVYGNTYDSNVHYVAAVSDAAAAANAGFFTDAESGERVTPNYILLAQPVLTTVLSKNNAFSVYADLQQKYQEKSNGLALYQASIFVKKTVNKDTANLFLDSLKEDIETVIKTPEEFTTTLGSLDNANTIYGIAPQVATNVTKNNNGMGLGFKMAKENKSAVENFLKLFNIEGLDEEIYF